MDTRPKRIGTTMATLLLIEDGTAESLTYDFTTKRILLDGEVLEPKLFRVEFGVAHFAEISVEELQTALYGLARKNSPKPELEIDRLAEHIRTWLKENKKLKVTTSQIITECLGGKLLDLTKRGLEMRIASTLTDLGYRKCTSMGKRYWTKRPPRTKSKGK